MTVVVFIIILLILLVSHEFGHFIMAKKMGMGVEEFGIGFPPKISSKKIGETVYSLNAIPFGAFVKILGEDGEKSESRSSRSFSSKSLGAQASVIVAGVVAHVLLAIILYWALFAVGMPTAETPATYGQLKDVSFLVAEVVPGSPADRAGILQGAEIISIYSGEDVLEILEHEQLVSFVGEHADEEIVINWRDRKTLEEKVSTLIPELSSKTQRPAIGIATARVGILQLPIHKAFISGVKEMWGVTVATFGGYGDLISKAVKGEANLNSVTGPIGIAGIVGDAWRLGFVYVVSLTAILSINLAIINLVPFPALDGGRLLFILIERVTKRTISPKVTQTVNALGFGLLIIMMLVITYHDIVKLVIS